MNKKQICTRKINESNTGVIMNILIRLIMDI